MPPKKSPEVVRGNTNPNHDHRVRWFPSFTSFLTIPPVWNEDKMKYLCYGEEICKTSGRKHYQGCVYFKDKVSIKQAQKLLKIEKSHMETNQKSKDINDAITYCKKEGKYTEYGNIPEQGKRTDLNALKDELLNTNITCDDICLRNPIMFHQYGRTLERIEEIKLRKKYRTEMTKGIWLWGDTGKGKSHRAFENYSPDTHFTLNLNDGGFWDGYTGQEIVIINEFRGQIMYSELLDLVDKYPKTVKRKNKCPVPFISKKVIITSSMSPYEVYKNVNAKDSLSQLERRFEIICLNDDGQCHQPFSG
jgi:hypothetical protein